MWEAMWAASVPVSSWEGGWGRFTLPLLGWRAGQGHAALESRAVAASGWGGGGPVLGRGKTGARWGWGQNRSLLSGEGSG